MQNVLTVISLKNIKSNALVFKRLAKKPLIAVVKDDAYGHGAEEVARAIEDTVDGFAVATVDEGATLKIAGIQKDILVLTPPLSEEEVVRIYCLGLVATVSSTAALKLILRAQEKFGFSLRAHIAVNTGMNRYGFRPERAKGACRAAAVGGVSVEGVYSHYYAPENERIRHVQAGAFEEACKAVREYFPNAMRHIAATGGTLAGGELYDAVRIGIGLYGYLPGGFESFEIQLKPAMKIYATVAQGGKFTGGGAGYNIVKKDYEKVHTLRLGYGDGFHRSGGIGIGKLCMDAAIREGRGDFGMRRIAVKDISAYAKSIGTTEYEVLVGAGKKSVKK
ncbi:MAG: alanine racemase, partial [Clostridia bacterium]|nr:alanine racemase [Clostridia bacterium]